MSAPSPDGAFAVNGAFCWTRTFTTSVPAGGMLTSVSAPSPNASAGPLGMPVEALDQFTQLLTEAEGGSSASFYGSIAAAVCRVASLRRAVLFAYDD